MVLPHLVLAHLLADYVLQTNWIVNKKKQFIASKPGSWDGLLIHGLIIWILALALLARYFGTLWPYITLLALLHTAQDAFKIRLSPAIDRWAFVPYAADQTLHFTMILVFSALTTGLATPPPGPAEIQIVAICASLIALTRLYEVTWWANLPDMLPYMQHWRMWGYIERTTMFALTSIGLWWLAPLVVVPRLIAAQRSRFSILKQRRHVLEVLLGMAFSVILGFAF